MKTDRTFLKVVAIGAVALSLTTTSTLHASAALILRAPSAAAPATQTRRRTAAASSAVTTYTVLHSFTGGDGSNPQGELLEDQNKNIYGVTNAGGSAGDGTVFEYTAAGALTTLHTFTGADGENPQGGLLNSYGNLNLGATIYGCTSAGGSAGYGTIYSITNKGVFSTMHMFSGGKSDGGECFGTLLFFTDGNIYGTTSVGGAYGYGTVFQITTKGAFKTIHSFNVADGETPLAGLAGSANGKTINSNMFGVTSAGAAHGAGSIFEISTSGAFKNLHSLTAATDGSAPLAELIPDDSGNLYGTNSAGGSGTGGTIFAIAAATGKYALLYSFPMGSPTAMYPNGQLPLARLAGYKANMLYGSTAFGGSGNGVLFTLSGTALTLVHTFGGPDGQFPAGQLLVSPDGNIYGTTLNGGSDIDGVLFALPNP